MYSELYCSGFLTNRCAVGHTNTSIGNCFWYTPPSATRKQNAQDIWNPERMNVFNRSETLECMKGKHILLAGDSTTRDTFYQLVTMNNIDLFTTPIWTTFYPKMPLSSMGKDRTGTCMANDRLQKGCIRHIQTMDGSFAFHFLVEAHKHWQLKEVLSIHDNFTHIFVQCPVYKWFNASAYGGNSTHNSRTSRNSRHIIDVQKLSKSCRIYVDHLREQFKHAKFFLLGTTPLPGWTKIDNRSTEPIITNALNKEFGIECSMYDSANGISYTVKTNNTIPIDRYAIVGHRRRDAIHPYFNAQFAITQLMMNSMC